MVTNLVAVITYFHPDDDATCEYCGSMLNEYQGAVLVVGSAEYFDAAGPYHGGCRYWESFDLVPPEQVGMMPNVLDAVPPGSKVWDKCHKSLWPLAVWPLALERLRKKERAVKYEAPKIDYEYDLVDECLAWIRKHIRAGKSVEETRKLVEKRYGILTVEVAWQESGL
jgi:hypothetical protein